MERETDENMKRSEMDGSDEEEEESSEINEATPPKRGRGRPRKKKEEKKRNDSSDEGEKSEGSGRDDEEFSENNPTPSTSHKKKSEKKKADKNSEERDSSTDEPPQTLVLSTARRINLETKPAPLVIRVIPPKQVDKSKLFLDVIRHADFEHNEFAELFPEFANDIPEEYKISLEWAEEAGLWYNDLVERQRTLHIIESKMQDAQAVIWETFKVGCDLANKRLRFLKKCLTYKTLKGNRPAFAPEKIWKIMNNDTRLLEKVSATRKSMLEKQEDANFRRSGSRYIFEQEANRLLLQYRQTQYWEAKVNSPENLITNLLVCRQTLLGLDMESTDENDNEQDNHCPYVQHYCKKIVSLLETTSQNPEKAAGKECAVIFASIRKAATKPPSNYMEMTNDDLGESGRKEVKMEKNEKGKRKCTAKKEKVKVKVEKKKTGRPRLSTVKRDVSVDFDTEEEKPLAHLKRKMTPASSSRVERMAALEKKREKAAERMLEEQFFGKRERISRDRSGTPAKSHKGTKGARTTVGADDYSEKRVQRRESSISAVDFMYEQLAILEDERKEAEKRTRKRVANHDESPQRHAKKEKMAYRSGGSEDERSIKDEGLSDRSWRGGSGVEEDESQSSRQRFKRERSSDGRGRGRDDEEEENGDGGRRRIQTRSAPRLKSETPARNPMDTVDGQEEKDNRQYSQDDVAAVGLAVSDDESVRHPLRDEVESTVATMNEDAFMENNDDVEQNEMDNHGWSEDSMEAVELQSEEKNVLSQSRRLEVSRAAIPETTEKDTVDAPTIDYDMASRLAVMVSESDYDMVLERSVAATNEQGLTLSNLTQRRLGTEDRSSRESSESRRSERETAKDQEKCPEVEEGVRRKSIKPRRYSPSPLPKSKAEFVRASSNERILDVPDYDEWVAGSKSNSDGSEERDGNETKRKPGRPRKNSTLLVKQERSPINDHSYSKHESGQEKMISVKMEVSGEDEGGQEMASCESFFTPPEDEQPMPALQSNETTPEPDELMDEVDVMTLSPGEIVPPPNLQRQTTDAVPGGLFARTNALNPVLGLSNTFTTQEVDELESVLQAQDRVLMYEMEQLRPCQRFYRSDLQRDMKANIRALDRFLNIRQQGSLDEIAKSFASLNSARRKLHHTVIKRAQEVHQAEIDQQHQEELMRNQETEEATEMVEELIQEYEVEGDTSNPLNPTVTVVVMEDDHPVLEDGGMQMEGGGRGEEEESDQREQGMNGQESTHCHSETQEREQGGQTEIEQGDTGSLHRLTGGQEGEEHTVTDNEATALLKNPDQTPLDAQVADDVTVALNVKEELVENEDVPWEEEDDEETEVVRPMAIMLVNEVCLGEETRWTEDDGNTVKEELVDIRPTVKLEQQLSIKVESHDRSAVVERLSEDDHPLRLLSIKEETVDALSLQLVEPTVESQEPSNGMWRSATPIDQPLSWINRLEDSDSREAPEGGANTDEWMDMGGERIQLEEVFDEDEYLTEEGPADEFMVDL